MTSRNQTTIYEAGLENGQLIDSAAWVPNDINNRRAGGEWVVTTETGRTLTGGNVGEIVYKLKNREIEK